ncbi:MAG TPA: hypothetical protein VNI01_07115, partial [Elusimicrobiota bacterium]|nr:hypothetical protein [Elusimicrobiota bacterium]
EADAAVAPAFRRAARAARTADAAVAGVTRAAGSASPAALAAGNALYHGGARSGALAEVDVAGELVTVRPGGVWIEPSRVAPVTLARKRKDFSAQARAGFERDLRARVPGIRSVAFGGEFLLDDVDIPGGFRPVRVPQQWVTATFEGPAALEAARKSGGFSIRNGIRGNYIHPHGQFTFGMAVDKALDTPAARAEFEAFTRKFQGRARVAFSEKPEGAASATVYFNDLASIEAAARSGELARVEDGSDNPYKYYVRDSRFPFYVYFDLARYK